MTFHDILNVFCYKKGFRIELLKRIIEVKAQDCSNTHVAGVLGIYRSTVDRYCEVFDESIVDLLDQWNQSRIVHNAMGLNGKY